jgi:hypothetical protein
LPHEHDSQTLTVYRNNLGETTMSLTTYHTNWLTGSYQDDLHFLLKVAENNPLRLNPTNAALLKPHLDSKGNIAIGYGYDLAKNKSTAKADLEAAGVSVSAEAEQIIQDLTAPSTATVLDQLAAVLTLPKEPLNKSPC